VPPRIIADTSPLWYRVYEFGYPFCHERCSRNYWLVVYDVGDEGETSYKLGMN
jgi:hypothetical protein